jgi:LPXTG-motif cell wall-anchored protein
MKKTDLLPAAMVAAIIVAIFWFGTAPADAQERCTVQSFDPPIGPTFAMPGDADTIRITLADGGGLMLVGPFVLGDMVDAGGLIVALEKCTGSIPAPEPTPEPQPTPTVPTPDPTPIPEPTPTPIVSCCTTVVTPGPEPTPTVITSTPMPNPRPPVDPTPTPHVPDVPDVPVTPELPATGSTSGPLVVAALFALAVGWLLVSAARRG